MVRVHLRLVSFITIFCGVLAVVCLAQSAALEAQEVSAAGPDGLLKGMLLRAEEQKAGVVIIPGSGPIDRDGNFANGSGASTYKLLAEALAQKGISSLRIDKRGMFSSSAAISDPNNVTIAGYGDDLIAWSNVLRRETGLSCVWFLGHSEGGLVALKAVESLENRSEICGLLLVAAPGRPVGVLLREQLAANPSNAPVLEDANAAIDALERGERVDTDGFHPALASLFSPGLQRYMIDLFSHDPARLIAAYDGPTLILQGERDLQVTAEDAQMLAAANTSAELRMLNDTTHMLKAVTSSDVSENMATYSNPHLPLADGVEPAITDFVLQTD
ncbi:alpha/beta hydrolase [Roseibium algae]|uniref:Alpha/beta hydrolase n=1 Tax=Roseibium algae TaxID=3123038 RepID=A0ABU8TK47_9HYPH